MTDRILKILDDVRYWETCPDNYKKDIETFLEEQNQALRIHDVVGRSEQFYCFDEKNKRIDRCENQCETCKGLKLMQ